MAETKKTTATTAVKKTTTKTSATKTTATKTTKTVKAVNAEVKNETVEQKVQPKNEVKSFNGPMLKITQVRSTNGRVIKQKRTMTALGLHKIGQSVVKKDNEQTRGMIFVVSHLVKVEKI